MADITKIAWTDHTANFWLGCQHWSRGCDNCYADTWTNGRMGLDVFGGRGKRQRTTDRTWKQAVKWNRDAVGRFGRPARVFCMSLGDFFEDAPGPNAWRPGAWEVIRSTPWLDWQLLTKRPDNIQRMLPDDWDTFMPLAGDQLSLEASPEPMGFWPHVWLGTSIEDNRVAERASVLTTVPAWVHFISYEPAIGPGDEISLDHVEWLIAGGESGTNWRERPMDLAWAREIWVRCVEARAAFFFKQHNGPRSDMHADALGRVVREFPASWDRRVS